VLALTSPTITNFAEAPHVGEYTPFPHKGQADVGFVRFRGQMVLLDAPSRGDVSDEYAYDVREGAGV